MKKILISMLALALAAGQYSAAAQERGQGNGFNIDKMDEAKAEAMVKDLAISDELVDQFVLTYKEYQKELREADPKFKEMMNMDPAEARKARKEKKNLTDQEIEEKIVSNFSIERAKIDIKEKYFGIFKEFLNAKQLDKIFNQPAFGPSQNARGGMGGPGGMPGGMGGPGF